MMVVVVMMVVLVAVSGHMLQRQKQRWIHMAVTVTVTFPPLDQ